jgi:hypothetical protein
MKKRDAIMQDDTLNNHSDCITKHNSGFTFSLSFFDVFVYKKETAVIYF